MKEITKFVEGKSYMVRYITSDLTYPIQVVKRTAKTIVVKGRSLDNKRLKIQVYDGAEYVLPYGSYSMAPVLRSTKEAA